MLRRVGVSGLKGLNTKNRMPSLVAFLPALFRLVSSFTFFLCPLHFSSSAYIKYIYWFGVALLNTVIFLFSFVLSLVTRYACMLSTSFFCTFSFLASLPFSFSLCLSPYLFSPNLPYFFLFFSFR